MSRDEIASTTIRVRPSTVKTLNEMLEPGETQDHLVNRALGALLAYRKGHLVLKRDVSLTEAGL